LEFSNGRVVLVTQLRVGQHATVLQLPAASPSNQSGTESNEPVSPGMTGEQSSAVGKGLLPVLVESSGRRTR
jgi:hypothetical protein